MKPTYIILIAATILGYFLLDRIAAHHAQSTAENNVIATHCEKYCMSEAYGTGYLPEDFIACIRDCMD